MELKKVLLGALVAWSAVALATEDAQAFWGSRGSWGSYGGSWGSNGSYGSSGSYGSAGSWGSSGSWGSRGSYGSHGSHGGRFFRRWARHGSNGSYGSSGSWGSNGSHGSAGSAGGHASYGYGGTYVESVAAKATPATTKLTVRVPSDAKVTLAGTPTKQIGEVREFATGRLAAGQTWDNYTVHVEVTRDGKTLVEDRTIMLTGGQAQELSFDLGGTQLAQVN